MEQNWYDQEKAHEGNSPRAADTERQNGCVPIWVWVVLSIAYIGLYIWILLHHMELLGLVQPAFVSGAAAIALLGIGLTSRSDEKNATDGCTVPVAAVIAAVEAREFPHGRRGTRRTYYAPVYAYQLNGRTIRVQRRGWSLWQDKFPVGQQVEMLVAPGAPERYRIPGESDPILRSAKVKIALGVLMAVVSAVLWGLTALALL